MMARDPDVINQLRDASTPPPENARSSLRRNLLRRMWPRPIYMESVGIAGKELQAAQDAGVPAHLLPPPPPTDDQYDDRVQCPHCMRKFNANAAERHIPKCTSIQAKPKTLVRGARPGLTPGRGAGRHVL